MKPSKHGRSFGYKKSDFGKDSAGHSVKIYGNTPGKYMEWDADTDTLNIEGGINNATIDDLSSQLENIENQIGYSHYYDLESFMLFGDEIISVIGSDKSLTLTRDSATYFGTPLFFQNAKEEMTFKTETNDTWFAIGGVDFSACTLLNFNFSARPGTVRLADVGASVRITDLTSIEYQLGDWLKVKIVDDNVSVYSSNDDKYSWTLIISIDLLTDAPTIINWIDNINLGAAVVTDGVVGSNYKIYGEVNTDYKSYVNYLRAHPLSGEDCGFGGDSITAQAKYVAAVADRVGCEAVNLGLSSSTLAINNTYLTDSSLVERIIGLNGNVRASDHDNWYLLCTFNDWLYSTPIGVIGDGDNTTYNGALEALLEDLSGRDNFPTIQMSTMYQTTYNGANSLGLTIDDYNEAVRDNCKKYGIVLTDLYYISGINQINVNDLTSDGIHINDSGADKISPIISDGFIKVKL